jgi:hypothetical protein
MNGMRLYGDRKAGILVCEPQVRIIKITVLDVKGQRYNKKAVNLAFPYLYMWGASKVGMSRFPMEENKEIEVYPIPLPNCHPCCTVCGIHGKDLVDYAKVFWNSVFGAEGSYYGGERTIKSTMKNIRTWEKLTQVDPTFIINPSVKYGTDPIKIPFDMKTLKMLPPPPPKYPTYR